MIYEAVLGWEVWCMVYGVPMLWVTTWDGAGVVPYLVLRRN